MAERTSKRLIHIDGARGYLLLMMFLAHFSFTHWTPLYYLHHGNYTPVFDGEFFVLLSGFVCALSYHRAFVKGGAWECEKAVLRRLRWVYLYQITVAMAMVALSVAALPIRISDTSLETLQLPVLHQLFSTLTFARMPQYLDILILYMSLMLFIPVALILLSRGKIFLYWLILSVSWIIAWFRIDMAVFDFFATHVFDPTPYFRLRGSFNPFSYAIVFYSGVYLGYRYKVEGPDAFANSVLPLRIGLFAPAALVVLAFMIAELLRSFLGTPIWIYDPERYEITPVGLIGLTAISYCIYFLLSADNVRAPLSWLAYVLEKIFTFPLFVMIGQNSLFFYSLHVMGVFGSSYVIHAMGMTASRPFILLAFAITTSLMITLTYAKRRFFPSLP